MKTRNASREFPGPNGKPLLVEILTAEAAVVVREKHERDGCKFTVAQLWAMAQKLKKGSLELDNTPIQEAEQRGALRMAEAVGGAFRKMIQNPETIAKGPSLITVPDDAVITEQTENRTVWSFGTNRKEPRSFPAKYREIFGRLNPFRK